MAAGAKAVVRDGQVDQAPAARRVGGSMLEVGSPRRRAVGLRLPFRRAAFLPSQRLRELTCSLRELHEMIYLLLKRKVDETFVVLTEYCLAAVQQWAFETS